MAAPSGLDGQLGVKVESTYGTGVTVDRFFEALKAELEMDIGRVESKAIRTGTRVQRSDRWRPGSIKVDGPIELEVLNKSFGWWFLQMFGAVATSGPVSTLYTHTFTPGDLTGDFFTAQIGKPDAAGTVNAFTYEGCKIKSWELACKVDEPLTLKLDVVGEDERSSVTSPGGPALASASYPSAMAMLVFIDGSITVAGSAFSVKDFSLKGDNGLAVNRRFIGSQLIKQPLEAGQRQYTGELSAEFNDTVAYGRFVSGTEAAVVLTFAVTIAAVTFSLTITMNARFDGKTPKLSGVDMLENKLPFKCTDTGAGAQTAITAVYVTTDATP